MKNAVVALTVLCFSSLSFAHNLPVNTKWESDYLVGKGIFSMVISSSESVTVYEYKNSCILNYLGTPFACTKMGILGTEGVLKYVPVATDRMTAIWRVENSPYQIVHRLSDEINGSMRLLKVDNSGRVVESVRLFKVEKNN